MAPKHKPLVRGAVDDRFSRRLVPARLTDMTAIKTFSIHQCPVGPLLLSGDRHALTGLEFADGAARDQESASEATGFASRADWRRDDARFVEERRQLSEYFAGE